MTSFMLSTFIDFTDRYFYDRHEMGKMTMSYTGPCQAPANVNPCSISDIISDKYYLQKTYSNIWKLNKIKYTGKKICIGTFGELLNIQKIFFFGFLAEYLLTEPWTFSSKLNHRIILIIINIILINLQRSYK